MNWLKQKKLLKRLFNKNAVFYFANGKYHFETEIKNDETIKLIKEYLNNETDL